MLNQRFTQYSTTFKEFQQTNKDKNLHCSHTRNMFHLKKVNYLKIPTAMESPWTRTRTLTTVSLNVRSSYCACADISVLSLLQPEEQPARAARTVDAKRCSRGPNSHKKDFSTHLDESEAHLSRGARRLTRNITRWGWKKGKNMRIEDSCSGFPNPSAQRTTAETTSILLTAAVLKDAFYSQNISASGCV